MNERDLQASEYKSQTDKSCKILLGDKQLLSWILKGVVSEVKDYSCEEIETFIEGKIKISSEPVHMNEKITGNQTESPSEDEGTVFFDVLFDLDVPHANQYIRIIINIEAQNEFDPGYHLETRGIYYCGRHISSQKNRIFTGSDYDKLCKVYSIWICFDAGKHSDAITEYTLRPNHLYGNYETEKEFYDKISVVMVCLPKKLDSDNRLLSVLKTVFSKALSSAEKIQRMREVHGINLKEDTERKVEAMCNYSDYVESEATQRGLEKGMEKGLRALVNSLKAFIPDVDQMYKSVTQNEDYADVTREEIQQLMAK